MGTWIESHQDLRSNPKTRRAARALDVSVPALMGHLHCLWHWALDHAEDGDVSPFDAEDLADAAGWDGDAERFVAALTECGPGEKAGFLEPDGLIGDPDDGKSSPLALHDWWEYAGKLIAKRRKDAERKARARARDSAPPSEAHPAETPETSEGCPEDVRVTAQVPNPTEHTEPTEPKPKANPVRARARDKPPPADNGRSPPDAASALRRVLARHSTSDPRPQALDADPALAAAVDELGWGNVGRLNLDRPPDRRKLQSAYDRARKTHR